ncbi:hypothetical protein DFP97_104108 [Paenibacillus prosopidis]|uniref:Uncharacterized protein n=1 Tax=Paenibacillus prosopidis TaxID=630520 RepID=A0A368W2R9_9BACL|nr:hypothetical protein DFP97_104108 [Paenibacillus prosopidis]
MKFFWFSRKKYHCLNGHSFKNYLVMNGSKRCPKCATVTIYKRAE